jgi:hypothetical protein
MNALMTMIKHVLTEADGMSYDIIRVLAVLTVPVGLVYAGYDLIMLHNHFDLQQFGIGVGAMFTGVGLALKLRPESGQ